MPRALRAAALLASAARAWDVRTPTNTTCLGGCACVPRLRACVPTAPAKGARVLALSLASLARHGADVAEVWVVSRRAAGVDAAVAAANRVRPVARWLDEAAHFPFDYAGVRAALGAMPDSNRTRMPKRQLSSSFSSSTARMAPNSSSKIIDAVGAPRSSSPSSMASILPTLAKAKRSAGASLPRMFVTATARPPAGFDSRSLRDAARRWRLGGGLRRWRLVE